MKKTVTFISDTHTLHNSVTSSLPGGDILVHSGDVSGRGSLSEVTDFLKWFNKVEGYTHKVFIAGNHDFGFQTNPETYEELIKTFNGNIIYLKDELIVIDGVKIYGSPWQPEFNSWAFNLPRNGKELKEVWDKIPNDIDLLITHGPAYGTLDFVKGGGNVGCEKLKERLDLITPKIHCFGHIHDEYGYKYDGAVHSINASVLDDRYHFAHKPITIEWDVEFNNIEFL